MTVVVVVVLPLIVPEIVHSVCAIWIAEMVLLISSEVTALPVVEIPVGYAIYSMVMSVTMSVLVNLRMKILLAEVLGISVLRRRWIMCTWNFIAPLLMELALVLVFVFVSVMLAVLVFSLRHF